MRLKKILVILLILGFAAEGTAEFYRYENNHGETVFTDDLSGVPQDQRLRALPYQDLATDPVLAKDSEEYVPSDSAGGQEEIREENENGVNGSEDIVNSDAINVEREALENEYARLAEEKEWLGKSRAQVETQEELKQYHEKIVNLNERISDYEHRRKIHSDRVDEFNAQTGE